MFTKKKHICPNRSSHQSKPNTTTAATEPTYSSKRPWSNTTPKPKMSNSFELLTGPSVDVIQQKYEILSDIVTEYNGKVNGSQRGQDPKTGQLIDLLVYYEVPSEGNKRDKVKSKFNNCLITVSISK